VSTAHRRERVIPMSPAARQILTEARRLDPSHAQVWDRMPASALRPAPVRCYRPWWRRLADAVRSMF
jgi:hypothetical protein